MAVSVRSIRRFCYWFLLVAAALAVAAGLLLTARSVHVAVDDDTSMEPAIAPGDHLLYVAPDGLRRGDIVLYRSAGLGLEVRRVIALPGDHVTCCNGQHRLTVDGHALRETYVYPGERPSQRTFSVTLGPGRAWLLGDHRLFARDSSLTGPGATSAIAGRVTIIDHQGRLTSVRTPATFLATGLAPPDNRPVLPLPWPVVALAGFALLVLLLLGGIIAQVVRRVRRREARLAPA
ncbi:MAG TPA: signal peptidase I [Streptosporangiaceae bacterium]